MVWLILDFQDSFFFFCLPQAHVWPLLEKKGFVFFPPQNSNVAGSAKWAQIRKIPNYSIIRRTNWIFSFATTTWYICLLTYTVKNVSVIVKHYGTTYPNSPLSVHCMPWPWHFFTKEVCFDVGFCEICALIKATCTHPHNIDAKRKQSASLCIDKTSEPLPHTF